MKKLIAILFSIICVVSIYATVSTYSYPPGRLTESEKQQWDAILNLFSQRASDTLSGDLTITNGNVVVGTAGKGLVIKEGTDGRSGRIAFQTGVLTVISNTTVTANSRVVLTKATTTAPLLNTMIATNLVSVGFQLIPAVAETNTYNFFIYEGQ